MYLARLLEKASDEETRETLLCAAAVHTPIAWGHINFSEEKLKDALGILPLEIHYLKTALKTGGREAKNIIKNKKYTRNILGGFVPLF